MKYTLLEMTQDILSNLSSDEVNSISDTTESLQVARIIRQKYFDIIDRVPLSEQRRLIQFTPSLDPTQPVVMYVPSNVVDISWVKYFNSNTIDFGVNEFQHDLNVDITPSSNSGTAPPGYADVKGVTVHEFLNMVTGFNTANPSVATYQFAQDTTGQTYKLYYRTDRTPQYYTVIANNFILFDSFDKTVDSTLQANKIMAHGQVMPTFTMSDSFIPDLADEQFPLLLNEAKLLAFYELKQEMHPLAMQETKRGWSTVQKNKSVDDIPSYFDALPNYGRGAHSGWGAVPSYFKLRGFDRP